MDDKKLALSKADFHRRQADLPFEEKIRAVVRMQRMTLELSRLGRRRPPRFVWDIEEMLGDEVESIHVSRVSS